MLLPGDQSAPLALPRAAPCGAGARTVGAALRQARAALQPGPPLVASQPGAQPGGDG